MPPTRYLIVNADDFGLSSEVNRGIITAVEDGIVTSASLMVCYPSASEAAEYGRKNQQMSLGLHVDLAEWIYHEESWVPVYERVTVDDRNAVTEEVDRQLARFRHLVGQDPTHLDSHQHAHRHEPVRSVLLEIAANLRIPLRHYTANIHYCGEFYGQTGKGEPYAAGIRVEALIETLVALPSGITELGCHPGFANDLDSIYRSERAQEVDVLCDPRVRAAIHAEKIELRSFRNMPAA